MKNTVINFTREFLENLKFYSDYLLFILIVLGGFFTKVYFAILKGQKPTWKWFLAEALLSFFVAFSVWTVFDQFLHFNKMFTYVACAWGGSMSTVMHGKVEELITSIFDGLKQFINDKFK